MNIPLQRLIELLESDDLQIRIAAIRVITQLGVRSKPAVQALGRCLKEPHDELRLVALKGLARLGAGDVVPMVVPLILSSGPLREQAMAVMTAVGPPVVPQLRSLYPQADFHGKRSIITALARIGGKDAVSFLLKILPEEPFELQKHLTLCLSEALDRMPTAAQGSVLGPVLRLFSDRRMARHPQILVTGAVLLGRFRGPAQTAKARAQLRSLADKKYVPEIRRHALLSFGRLLGQGKPAPADYQFLFKALCDEDWHNVAQHALQGLHRLSLEPRFLPRLVELLHKSPHFSVHIHVFERLQNTDRPEVAQAVLPFLSDARFRVREAAERALRRMPTSIESLFQLLMKTEDLEVTQRVNAILRDFPQQTRSKYVDRAISRLMTLFERNDPHYRSFLEFVKNLDPEPLRKRIYHKAHQLKRSRAKDRWERMAALIQLLWDNHMITAEGRYLLAVALVRLNGKDLAPASRRANLGLRVLRSLIYDDWRDLAKRLIEDKDLRPEDYYYLGFHFSEEGEELRPFAKTMLEHVVKTSPRSAVAGPAGHKLSLHIKEEVPAATDKKRTARKGAAASPEKKPPRVAAAPAAKRPERKSREKKPSEKKTPQKRRPEKKPQRQTPKAAKKATKGGSKARGGGRKAARPAAARGKGRTPRDAKKAGGTKRAGARRARYR